MHMESLYKDTPVMDMSLNQVTAHGSEYYYKEKLMCTKHHFLTGT